MKELIEYAKNSKNMLVALEKELLELPDGYLQRNKNNYKHRIGKTDKGITNDIELIKKLCRKRLVEELLKQLKHNLRVFAKDGSNFCQKIPAEIIDNLPANYQGLPFEYFFHPAVPKWLNQKVIKNSYPMESGWLYSNNGIPLRSKSEVFIANMLEKYNLPYHYDVAMRVGKKTMYPDFIIMNPYTAKTIIWEHFGALHDAKYEKKMDEKMNDYLIANYQPQKTIIYTFEADVKNPKRLEEIIKTIIL